MKFCNSDNNYTTTPRVLLCEFYVLVYFIFAFQDLHNSVPWGPPLHYVLVHKILIYVSKITLASLLTTIFVFHIKIANFSYITCIAPNLIPIWSESHGLLAAVFLNLGRKSRKIVIF